MDQEAVRRATEAVATGLEVAGVVVLLIGLAAAAVGYARAVRKSGWAEPVRDLRSSLGRAILLGLEVLVAADIVSTIGAPLTVESVGLLAAVVVIRTFLSFSLETEIEGAWPWRRRALERAESRRLASAPEGD